MNTFIVELIERRPELEVMTTQIESAHEMLARCFHNGGRIYICGNGGSAADSEHWAGELLKGFYSKRPICIQNLPTELSGLQGGLPAIPLTGFYALRTAVANDIDPSLEFAQLVWALGRTGDILVGISTSGNAENVGLAAKAAIFRNMNVIGMTGQNGGKLKDLVDLCINVPEQKTHLIQELHLSIYHTLCLSLEAEFFPEKTVIL